VRQTLQKRREERLEPPPLAVPLPDDKRVRDLNVKTHALTAYDQINETPQEKSQQADKRCQPPSEQTPDNEKT
jgi:hypothetical protein